MRKIKIDIVADVVCPWCYIGYARLQKAIKHLEAEIDVELYWYPFELNPAIVPGGESLLQYLARQYKTSEQACRELQEHVTKLGYELGIKFDFDDDMSIYNTRKAHQLVQWAMQNHCQQPMIERLFHDYFYLHLPLDNDEVLLNIATDVGLDRALCEKVIKEPSWSGAVASIENQWLQAGIQVVPAMIINEVHLMSGAQSEDVLIKQLREIAAHSHHSHAH